MLNRGRAGHPRIPSRATRRKFGLLPVNCARLISEQILLNLASRRLRQLDNEVELLRHLEVCEMVARKLAQLVSRGCGARSQDNEGTLRAILLTAGLYKNQQTDSPPASAANPSRLQMQT